MTTEREYTPGPWLKTQANWGSHYIHSPEIRQMYFLGKSSEVTTEQQLANASLIAAAPELLEALEVFIKYWSDEEGCSSPHYQDVHKARAAIAKALGQ